MPTARALGPEGWRKYIAAASKRPQETQLTAEDLSMRDSLVRRARDVASVLKGQYGATRVIMFGSLAHLGWFSPTSDVDLAVEGVSGNQYWDAWRVAEEMIPERRVDLIELETASPSLRHEVELHGVVL